MHTRLQTFSRQVFQSSLHKALPTVTINRLAASLAAGDCADITPEGLVNVTSNICLCRQLRGVQAALLRPCNTSSLSHKNEHIYEVVDLQTDTSTNLLAVTS